MDEGIFQALGIVFTLENFTLLCAGTVIGIITGALPGFNATNACAVMLPVTLAMSTEGALIFFAAVYAGAQYGGSIPAILVNTPGTPGAGATVLDGYPMAKNGQPDKALGISLMASCMGGLISSVLVLFTIKPLSAIAIKFGPAEMLMVTVFGLTIIVSVIGKNIKKGLAAGLFGLLIAAMMADPATSTPRLTFGFLELYDKVPFVPALIGLFAISELFGLLGKESVMTGDRENVGNFRELLSGITSVVKRPFITIKSALIGTIIGAIPGAGTTIATYLSYAEAQRTSKEREDFGKGAIDGIIASEAANNGVTGGALIPMLALGIPGSGTTAVMLAAIMLHGIRPGPELMKYFAPMSYSVIIAMGLASFTMFFFSVVLCKVFAKVSLIPVRILMPLVLIFCVIGSFAFRNSMFDTYLLIIFAVLGYIMKKNDYPMIPLVLGLILGPMAEANLYRTLQLSRGNLSILFQGAICQILWAAIVISLFGRPTMSAIKKALHK